MTQINSMLDEALYELNHYPGSSFSIACKNFARVLTGRSVVKDDRIFWPTGLLSECLLEVYIQLGKESAQSNGKSVAEDEERQKILGAMKEYFDRWIRGGSRVYYPDDGCAGYTLVALQEMTGSEKYREAADKLYEFLRTYRRDERGGIVYRQEQNNTFVFADGIGEMCPFLARYGKAYDNSGAINLAVGQILNYLEFGFDEKTGLPYHGYDAENGMKYGLLGWGRAVGWMMIGMVGTLESMNPAHPDYTRIKQAFRMLVSKVEIYQLEGGLYTWHLLAKEGPVDTSATGMILYAIAKGVELGILIENHKNRLNKGRQALQNCVKDYRVYGALSECKGFAEHPQIYGAYPWSQGPALALEYMQYGK